jgi:hypothetical protein
MSSGRTAEKARTAVLYCAVALFFLFICFTWGRYRLLGDGFFWDARVYARAIVDSRSGGDSYFFDPAKLPFANPPLFLRSAVWLSYLFSAHLGWYLYLALLVAATFTIPWVLSSCYIRSEWMTPVVALAIFAIQPRFFVERMMISGNVATLLYALVLLAGVPGIRRNRWTLFYLAVILAALVKPVFLALLILPILAGSRQFVRSALTAAAVFAAYAFERLSMSSLYLAFQNTLYLQLVVKHDAGTGLYSYFLNAGNRVALFRGSIRALIAHFSVVAILLAALFLLRKRKHLPNVERLWVPALVVMAVLANPRLQYYDLDIAILPAIYICVDCARNPSRSRRDIGALALSLTALMAVFASDASLGMCLLLLAAIVLPLVRMATSSSPSLAIATPELAGAEPLREIA